MSRCLWQLSRGVIVAGFAAGCITPAAKGQLIIPASQATEVRDGTADWALYHEGRNEGSGDVLGDGVLVMGIGFPSDGSPTNPFAFGFVQFSRVLIQAPGVGTHQILNSIRSPEAEGSFGQTVCMSNDVTGDGVADILVGAPDFGGHGRVYVFAGGAGTLVRTFEGIDLGEHFGYSIDSGCDFDGDGVKDIAVGAPGAVVNGEQRGCVRVYSGLSGALLRVYNGALGGVEFGSYVTAWVDGNGHPSIMIGGRAPNVLTDSLAEMTYSYYVTEWPNWLPPLIDGEDPCLGIGNRCDRQLCIDLREIAADYNTENAAIASASNANDRRRQERFSQAHNQRAKDYRGANRRYLACLGITGGVSALNCLWGTPALGICTAAAGSALCIVQLEAERASAEARYEDAMQVARDLWELERSALEQRAIRNNQRRNAREAAAQQRYAACVACPPCNIGA